LSALSFLIAGPAVAADMRAPAPRAPVAQPVAVYNWTGCYVGAGGGYGMFNQKTQVIETGVVDGVEASNGGRGWFGTVQVGCDYQVASNFVLGAFADYDFSDIRGDQITFPGFLLSGKEKLKSSWAAGGRIGWLPFPQLLVFVSGGYAEAQFGRVDFNFLNGPPFPWHLNKHTYSGWFIGSGYEYGIGWLPGLFWKTEYRFADFGSEKLDVISSTTNLPIAGNAVDNHKYIQTIRSELVWRFNFGGGPVVARY